MNAPDKATEIRALVTLVIGFFTALWGWLGWAIVLFVASMAADYVTGTWAARARGEWSSAAARQGLWHKLGEIAALLVAALCDLGQKHKKLVIIKYSKSKFFKTFQEIM